MVGMVMRRRTRGALDLKVHGFRSRSSLWSRSSSPMQRLQTFLPLKLGTEYDSIPTC